MLKRFVSLQTEDLGRAEKNAAGDLIVPMAFSSELPAQRWWGIEILDHADTSIRLERLKDGAPLLFNHTRGDIRGTHEASSIRLDKDRVLRGKVRITASTQVGRDTIGLVETKILTKASIGYRVHKVIEQTTKKSDTGELVEVSREIAGDTFERLIEDFESRGARVSDRGEFRRSLDAKVGPFTRNDDEEPVYRVVDWEPIENSLVDIPLDNTVGVGRSAEVEVPARISRTVVNPAVTANLIKETSMSKDAALAAEAEAAEKQRAERAAQERAEREAQEKLQRMSATELEAGRVRAISNLAKANSIPDNIRDTWVRQGYGLEEVSNDILKVLEERGKFNPQPASRLGLTGQEVQRFSLGRAILAAASKDNDWSKAGFELECSKSVAQKMGKIAEPHKFYIPFEVMERQYDPFELMMGRMRMGNGQRDLTVGTAGAGGFLVQTDNIGFIEMLRNRSVAFMMGARRLSGLQGSVTVPRQSAAATAVWLANEASQATESQQTFVQMAMAPKSVGAYTEISRQLLLQSSPGAEGIVTDDLAQVVAIAADLAVLEGTGAGGQPTGISGTAGIGSVTGTALAAAGIIEFQTDVASSNVQPLRGGYITTPAVAGLLMVRPELPSTGTERLWKGNIWDGSMFDLPAKTSNQLTAASMIFGDWNEVVVGEWGVLEVEVNPYANFQAGIIGVRAIYSMDVGVRRPFAFSRATSIT
jgi:HK97 family phage major capsid protein